MVVVPRPTFLIPTTTDPIPLVSQVHSARSSATSTGYPVGAVWGKQKSLIEPYPLVAHLLDTAAAARVLLDEFCSENQRAVLSRTGLTPTQVQDLVMVLAGWHDVGKAAAGWQAQIPELFEKFTGTAPSTALRAAGFTGHDTAGYAHLLDRGTRTGNDMRTVVGCAGHAMAQIVGGHHGAYPTSSGTREWWATPRFAATVGGPTTEGQQQWSQTRDDILTLVETVLVGRVLQNNWVPTLPVEASALLTGIVIVADWVVSQEHFITPVLPTIPADPAHLDLRWARQHFEGAQHRTRDAVIECGVLSPPLQARPFREVFGFPPRGVQTTIAETLPGRVHGAGIVVISAPTGDGKTEAALHAAAILAERCGSSGVLMALPTMATTNAAFTRVREFVTASSAPGGRVTLLHSLAALHPTNSPGARHATVTSAVSGCTNHPHSGGSCGSGLAAVTSWMQGSRRGMLAASSVSTIDQVLTLALRGKWQALRVLGVTRKVVIIDEAHAYDAYMQGLLRRTLTWLGACEVPVILLSATLSGRLARSLVTAYQAGLPTTSAARTTPIPAPTYPGWMHLDTTTGSVLSGPVPSTGRETIVGVDLVTFDGTDWNPEVYAQAAVTAAHQVIHEGADGNILIVCNTVSIANAVYRTIAGTSDVPVMLMHSRFPQYQRLTQEAQVEALYGKTCRTSLDGAAPARPNRSVLVATQVVEQSLDLDMDTVITDLAPAAMLLQRAGRSHRHHTFPQANAAGSPVFAVTRPEHYPTPKLTVLVPTLASGTLAPRDNRPYPQILLTRTHIALQAHLTQHPVGLHVPGDVQDLIDTVYDAGFANTDATDRATAKAEARNAHATQVMGTAAEHAAVPPPASVQCLSDLTTTHDPDTVLSARYNMNTVTVLPTWTSSNGVLWLNAACTLALPIRGAFRGRGGDRYFSPAQLSTIISHTIIIPSHDKWLSALVVLQDTTRPVTWSKASHLSNLFVVTFSARSADENFTTIAATRFVLTTTCGLETLPTT